MNYVTFLQNNQETGYNMEGGVNELKEIEEIELQQGGKPGSGWENLGGHY